MPQTPPDLEPLLQRGYRYALSLTHDRTTAEDLLQEACISILKSDGEWSVGLLIQAVRHRFIDSLRRKGLTMEFLDPDGLPPALEPLDHELDPALEEALRSLRPAEREILYLSAVGGLNSSEIAAAADRPRGTVLSLIHRAKRKVRQILIANEKSCGVRGEENHGA